MLRHQPAHPSKIGLRRHEAPEGEIGVVPAGVGLLHGAAELALEHLDRIAHDLAHLGIDRGVAPIGAVGHTTALEIAADVRPIEVRGG